MRIEKKRVSNYLIPTKRVITSPQTHTHPNRKQNVPKHPSHRLMHLITFK